MKIQPSQFSLTSLTQIALNSVLYLLACLLVAILVLGWVISELRFRFSYRVARRKEHVVHRGYSRPESQSRFSIAGAIALLIGFAITPMVISAQSQEPSAKMSVSKAEDIHNVSAETSIWQNGVGNGFQPGVQSVSINIGVGYGVKILGSQQSHDLAIASFAYGYTLGPIQGIGHWYRGNWELRGELFTGAQFSPSVESLVGLAPHLRYNFMTSTRWVPYVDVGAGVTATSIGPPDLSNTFEFNLQAATGMRWFIKDNFALGIEARYFHLSCAGLHDPNLGLNNIMGTIGITRFF